MKVAPVATALMVGYTDAHLVPYDYCAIWMPSDTARGGSVWQVRTFTVVA